MKLETADRKEVAWESDSLDVLKSFPEDVQDALGINLDRIQEGKRSPIAKHWEGPIWELRDNGENGKTYRLMYVAILADEITVLHCFDKISRKTSKKDSEIIRNRLAEVQKRKQVAKSIATPQIKLRVLTTKKKVKEK